MRLSTPALHLLSFLLFSLLHRAAFATKKLRSSWVHHWSLILFLLLWLYLYSYVVYLGSHSHSHGPELSQADLDRVTESHHEFLGSFLGSYDAAKESIFLSYTRHINGFAAILDDEVAAEIAKHPKVVSIFLSKPSKLHTTRSWEFLGLEHNGVIASESIWEKAKYGEDIIIGNIDSGVWPESKSFSDEHFGPIPSKWKGICQNDNDPEFRCNRKLIGARYFNKGDAALNGPLNSTSSTPRDYEGHGSHTLSTAAGNFVTGASVFGFGKGTAKGGSPKARVAAYKVSGEDIPGAGANILAAFDMAIHDGVDVLSVSLGLEGSFFNNPVAIGSFHAVKHGIVVVCSAGNDGPTPSSVGNIEPWLITVGASTLDREVRSYVILGNKMRLKGQSMSSTALPGNKLYPLIHGADARAANISIEDAQQCEYGSLDPKKVRGKILVCLPALATPETGMNALLAGAVGVVLANNKDQGNEIFADPHVLPASHISYNDGLALLNYIISTKSPKAYITRPKTTLGTKPAPFMASFSSLGPSSITPDILKPDITAPGVSIIATYTEAHGPSDLEVDNRRVPFNSISGTSMSCPHVSGIAGLLKSLHPTWSPAAIRSAIMTTAKTLDNKREPLLDATFFEATPFGYGAGHINPNGAMDPGLVYDLSINDYLNFVCALGKGETLVSLLLGSYYVCPTDFSLTSLNYPSISVSKLADNIMMTRTLKNVGSPGTYTAHVQEPKGISVNVKPKSLKFKKVGEEKSFNVILKVKEVEVAKDYVFGELIWSDKKHCVRSPIVVKAV